jgi:hypothetical protein
MFHGPRPQPEQNTETILGFVLKAVFGVNLFEHTQSQANNQVLSNLVQYMFGLHEIEYRVYNMGDMDMEKYTADSTSVKLEPTQSYTRVPSPPHSQGQAGPQVVYPQGQAGHQVTYLHDDEQSEGRQDDDDEDADLFFDDEQSGGKQDDDEQSEGRQDDDDEDADLFFYDEQSGGKQDDDEQSDDKRDDNPFQLDLDNFDDGTFSDALLSENSGSNFDDGTFSDALLSENSGFNFDDGTFSDALLSTMPANMRHKSNQMGPNGPDDGAHDSNEYDKDVVYGSNGYQSNDGRDEIYSSDEDPYLSDARSELFSWEGDSDYE